MTSRIAVGHADNGHAAAERLTQLVRATAAPADAVVVSRAALPAAITGGRAGALAVLAARLLHEPVLGLWRLLGAAQESNPPTSS